MLVSTLSVCVCVRLDKIGADYFGVFSYLHISFVARLHDDNVLIKKSVVLIRIWRAHIFVQMVPRRNNGDALSITFLVVVGKVENEVAVDRMMVNMKVSGAQSRRLEETARIHKGNSQDV